ncbi:hypothetical protein [Pseudogemmobacter sonorensis]|uniref:hypothetical protein n=1 Tax=Pseudogemmobacter sonorensis TaxID=2989681 RepID=UPI0036C23A3E
MRGKAAKVGICTRLGHHPSGCTVWMVVTEELAFDHFLWFGGAPGHPLPDISGFRPSRHSKGNAEGTKLERPAHRDMPRGAFTRISELPELCTRLLGPL